MRSQHIFTHSGTPADVNVLTNSLGKRPPFRDAESERGRPCADLRLVEQMPALAANERVKERLRQQSLYPNNKETQHAQITEFEIVATMRLAVLTPMAEKLHPQDNRPQKL
jgi:hypothetical protein